VFAKFYRGGLADFPFAKEEGCVMSWKYEASFIEPKINVGMGGYRSELDKLH